MISVEAVAVDGGASKHMHSEKLSSSSRELKHISAGLNPTPVPRAVNQRGAILAQRKYELALLRVNSGQPA